MINNWFTAWDDDDAEVNIECDVVLGDWED
jgi:hypothetical protein